MVNPVSGFYKKTKEQKIKWLSANYLADDSQSITILKKYWNSDEALQKLHDDFIENTISNYYLPLGVAPNFLINDNLYTIPMVIEESSVVAAASNAAKFWLNKGGFKAQVLSTIKNGQVHFNFFGNVTDLETYFAEIKPTLISSIDAIQKNMKKRGGGLLDIEFINITDTLEGYFQLHCTFETGDAMGANFINSCLEVIASTFKNEAQSFQPFKISEAYPEIVMSILSNYVPDCLVRAEVSCPVSKLNVEGMDGAIFANKIVRAVAIAKATPRRAVTHNKGIMNGIDAVVLATGNDFRAVEAGVHAYASKDGNYTSLTHAKVEKGIFKFWIELPLAIGTVGGLTNLHPLVKFAFSLLQKPNAKQLMEIIAVTGLAQNFAALKSLVTVGIQKGHMKMHLMNILNGLNASEIEKTEAVEYFKKHPVSHSAVVNFVTNKRT
ncbi:3-hydroxy-3-methylglutaryl coenzyme A reductase [Patiriisocius marinistellae]|uniref:3-hydroxy-3-methylglutaryl coenzyme A reductase n=1 Tax=Patiriisocius marinistellae TaxID=2494560 RepID=A0A5J4FYY8_9FLAO|nr:hydroxymethylglutaryl-CoA reductase, degradative [Patiriisocius marinistellae]GEQ85359.1 3-hydroxy-3-methylglutaryl coenzyme A reductase [Patiriisocius marinistellae]